MNALQPTETANPARLAAELRRVVESLNQVASVLERLSVPAQTGPTSVTPTTVTVEDALIRKFLSEEVRRSGKNNADLSTGELIEVWVEYCKLYALPTPPLTKVKRALPAAMLSLFGAVRTHSLIRDGRHCRGFRGVEFKPIYE
jgi:hypothetical protein